MKRGLVVLDPAEIPTGEWTERLAALQSELRRQGVDIGLIYNDVSRGDDIGYLTNLVIYWNEGVLAVPAEGEATLLTKLSKRVHAWMRRTSVLEDLRTGPTFAKLVAAYVEGRPAGTIGFVDGDLWPATVAEEIAAAVPGWRTAYLGPLVRDARAMPSAAELDLLRTGAGTLREALAAADAPGLGMRERMGALEGIARHGGFADVLLRGSDSGGHVTVEAAGEHRHGWLLVGRTYGAEEWITALAEAESAALAAIRPGRAWSEVEAAATSALAAVPAGATAIVRWVSQADFATGGELGPTSENAPAEGEVAAVVVEVVEPDGRRSVRADTFLVTGSGAQTLTV